MCMSVLLTFADAKVSILVQPINFNVVSKLRTKVFAPVATLTQKTPGTQLVTRSIDTLRGMGRRKSIRG